MDLPSNSSVINGGILSQTEEPAQTDDLVLKLPVSPLANQSANTKDLTEPHAQFACMTDLARDLSQIVAATDPFIQVSAPVPAPAR